MEGIMKFYKVKRDNEYWNKNGEHIGFVVEDELITPSEIKKKKDVPYSHDSGGTPIPEKDHANRVRLYRQTHSKQVDLFLCTLAFS